MATNGNTKKSKVSTSEAREANEPAARASRRRNRGASELADWGTANPDILLAAVSAVAARGCAIRFGYTRDGGTFAIGILGDGEPYTEYVRPTESIDEYLNSLLLDFHEQ